MANVERMLALLQHPTFLWQNEGGAVEGPGGPEGTIFWKRVPETLYWCGVKDAGAGLA